MGEVSKVGSTPSKGVDLGALPAWASSLADMRHVLRWDESQYIGYVGINGKLTCCIVDTGAHRTIIDT
jgi:hypothetical protein